MKPKLLHALLFLFTVCLVHHRAQADTACLDLTPGTSALVDGSMLPNEVSAQMRSMPLYRLKREADSPDGLVNFTALLALEFIPDENTDPSDIVNLTKTVSACYDKLPPIVVEHASLKLKLANSMDYVPAHKVYLTANRLRADSAHWSPLSDCRTILHESFHLLGLVDLYQEKAENPYGGLKYDCRKPGPDGALMAHIEWANFPRYYDTQYQRYQSNKPYDPKLTSLLYPAEFRMVTAPGCAAKNKVYYDCGQRAYESTHGPKGTLACSTVSTLCDDPHTWMQ